MQIREVNCTDADKRSAGVFFTALKAFYDLSTVTALDMFARNGQLTVANYAGAVEALDVWELMSEHAHDLASFAPREVLIGCSYGHLESCQSTYGLIVIDTPQGIHTDAEGVERFEHFDVLGQIDKLVADKALIVLYVNKRPYDKDEVGDHGYDQYASYDFPRWMERRKEFYGVNPQDVGEEDAIRAYRRVLMGQGLKLTNVLSVPCYSDVPGFDPYAYRVCLEVARNIWSTGQ